MQIYNNIHVYVKIMIDPCSESTTVGLWVTKYWSAGLALLLLLKNDIIIEGDYCWDVM